MKKSSDEWPPMAEMDFDADGLSIDGTVPISVVSIGMYGQHGKPHALIQSAGCGFCDRWAVDFYVGRSEQRDGPFDNEVCRRFAMHLVYFCDRHQAEAADEIMDEHGYGGASNILNFDLVNEVDRRRAARAMGNE